ncbi:MAG: hypothetical protein HPY52_13820 [Firmicutes bacterium]|nr:hypothetical protein [Bacillota bacterium]
MSSMHSSSPPKQLGEILAKIKKKAEMQADMHGQLADHYLHKQNTVYYGSLFTSCLLLSLTFVSDDFIARTLHLAPDWFKWLKALIAVVNFFAGLILAISKPSSHAARHMEAVNHYTRVLYAIRNLDSRDTVSEQDLKAIEDQYLDTGDLPRIPGPQFLKLKKRYLVKIAISRFLEDHPHTWIWLLKFKLWWRELTSGAMPDDTWTRSSKQIDS